MGLSLHSDFDAWAATPSELQDAATKLWQKYSLVPPSPAFSPLGEDVRRSIVNGVGLGKRKPRFGPEAGGCLALGADHVAYIL